MTNEMKLLTALCDALGFEVEIERDYDDRKVDYAQAMQHQSGVDYP
ncbi:unnamed protein product, partial [marine sediment metagenome]